jgi:hypothetical protein
MLGAQPDNAERFLRLRWALGGRMSNFAAYEEVTFASDDLWPNHFIG